MSSTPLQGIPLTMANSRIPKPKFGTPLQSHTINSERRGAQSTGATKSKFYSAKNSENIQSNGNGNARRHQSGIPKPSSSRRQSLLRPTPSSKRSLIMSSNKQEKPKLPTSLAGIELVLHRKDASWGSQKEMLEAAKLLIEKPDFPSEDDLTCLDRFATTLSHLLSQMRSQVVKDACAIVVQLVEKLGTDRFGQLAPRLVPELLRMTCSATATHLSMYSRKCLELVFQKCHVISLVDIFCDPTNAFLLRGGCGNMLVDLVMREWTDDEIEVQADLMEEHIITMSNAVFTDAATHKQCRWATYHFMHFRFSRAEVLFSNLREEDQRAMEIEFVDFQSKMQLFGGIHETIQQNPTESPEVIVAKVSPVKSTTTTNNPISQSPQATVSVREDPIARIVSSPGAITPVKPHEQPSRLEQLVTWKLHQLQEKDQERRHRLSISEQSTATGTSIASVSTVGQRAPSQPPLPPADATIPTPAAVKRYRALKTREQLYMSPSLKEFLPKAASSEESVQVDDLEHLLALEPAEPKVLSGVDEFNNSGIQDSVRAVATLLKNEHSTPVRVSQTMQVRETPVVEQTTSSPGTHIGQPRSHDVDVQLEVLSPSTTTLVQNETSSETQVNNQDKPCLIESIESVQQHTTTKVDAVHEDEVAEKVLKEMLDEHDKKVTVQARKRNGLKLLSGTVLAALVVIGGVGVTHPHLVSSVLGEETKVMMSTYSENIGAGATVVMNGAQTIATQVAQHPDVVKGINAVQHTSWNAYSLVHKHFRPLAVLVKRDVAIASDFILKQTSPVQYAILKEHLEPLFISAEPAVSRAYEYLLALDKSVEEDSVITANDEEVVEDDSIMTSKENKVVIEEEMTHNDDKVVDFEENPIMTNNKVEHVDEGEYVSVETPSVQESSESTQTTMEASSETETLKDVSFEHDENAANFAETDDAVGKDETTSFVTENTASETVVEIERNDEDFDTVEEPIEYFVEETVVPEEETSSTIEVEEEVSTIALEVDEPVVETEYFDIEEESQDSVQNEPLEVSIPQITVEEVNMVVTKENTKVEIDAATELDTEEDTVFESTPMEQETFENESVKAAAEEAQFPIEQVAKVTESTDSPTESKEVVDSNVHAAPATHSEIVSMLCVTVAVAATAVLLTRPVPSIKNKTRRTVGQSGRDRSASRESVSSTDADIAAAHVAQNPKESSFSPIKLLGNLVGRFNAVEIVQDGKTPQVTVKPVRRSHRNQTRTSNTPINVVLDAASIQFANNAFANASTAKTPRGIPMEVDTPLPEPSTRRRSTRVKAMNTPLAQRFENATTSPPNSANLRRSTRKNLGRNRWLEESS